MHAPKSAKFVSLIWAFSVISNNSKSMDMRFVRCVSGQTDRLIAILRCPIGAEYCVSWIKKVKVVHTRLPSVGFRSWSRFFAVSLQLTWVINPALGCHYVPPGPQLSSQPSRGLLPISLLGDQSCAAVWWRTMHDGCEQFAQHCYPTASRLRFEPGPYCACVQHANHSATEPPRM